MVGSIGQNGDSRKTSEWDMDKKMENTEGDRVRKRHQSHMEKKLMPMSQTCASGGWERGESKKGKSVRESLKREFNTVCSRYILI